MEIQDAKQARPHCELIAELLDSRQPKTEREHAAVREIERLRAELERAPRWRDVADELPREAQEVLFVRGEKTLFGAWIGGIFWHNNQKMAAAYWMPLPLPPNARVQPLP